MWLSCCLLSETIWPVYLRNNTKTVTSSVQCHKLGLCGCVGRFSGTLQRVKWRYWSRVPAGLHWDNEFQGGQVQLWAGLLRCVHTQTNRNACLPQISVNQINCVLLQTWPRPTSPLTPGDLYAAFNNKTSLAYSYVYFIYL